MLNLGIMIDSLFVNIGWVIKFMIFFVKVICDLCFDFGVFLYRGEDV